VKESAARKLVVEILQPLAGFAVENAVGVGQPDVCCTAGWLELKVAERPARPGHRVVPGLRSTQRVWMRRWTRSGGRAWVLTRLTDAGVDTGLCWLLHDGEWAAEHMDYCAEVTLQSASLQAWSGENPHNLCATLIKICRGHAMNINPEKR
jgi:hypothetical protein